MKHLFNDQVLQVITALDLNIVVIKTFPQGVFSDCIHSGMLYGLEGMVACLRLDLVKLFVQYCFIVLFVWLLILFRSWCLLLDLFGLSVFRFCGISLGRWFRYFSFFIWINRLFLLIILVLCGMRLCCIDFLNWIIWLFTLLCFISRFCRLFRL